MVVKVVNTHGVDEERVLQEIIRAEMRMNTGSLVRFHVQIPENPLGRQNTEKQLAQDLGLTLMRLIKYFKS